MHTIAGYEVYVEDGYILRGIKHDQNGGMLPAFVYRQDRNHSCREFDSWTSEEKIKPDAFRSGVRRGTIRLI